jgi:HK97 gp10 family phage protein
MAISRIKVDITGVKELQANAEKLKTNLFAVLAPAVMAGSDIARDYASKTARRKTGEMAEGIISTVTWERKGAPKAFAGTAMAAAKNNIFVKHSANGKRYYYPASIEYGHKGVKAYPFMRPALSKNRTKIRRAIRDRVKAIIDGVKS